MGDPPADDAEARFACCLCPPSAHRADVIPGAVVCVRCPGDVARHPLIRDIRDLRGDRSRD